ncbi:CBS domain-containing protein [Nocardioides caldifontis]|uniref:CBS domain-containing protein n=1 Tax=Nocardioides caldifontis TaxID=2588938 RepID=UPI0011DEFF5C|nr:CBS domain-containing protein [Nocardioides caldifontis]
MRIREIISAKSRAAGGSEGSTPAVVTVRPDATVTELLGVLAEHNVGALVVSSDGRTVEGIVSERDVVRRLHADPSVLSSNVEAIMTRDVHTCPSDTTLDDLMGEMTRRRFRHVPVVDDGVMVGIVSIGDVVKHKIDALQFERDQLDSYVHQT